MKVVGHSGSFQALLVVQLAVVFICLSVFSMGLHSLATAAKLYEVAKAQPVQVPAPLAKAVDTPQVPVDYQQIDALVQERVAALPKPNDGLPGTAGVNGLQGPQGEPGEDGRDAAPAREVELQSNPSNGNLEWRYVGDDAWQLLMKKCIILTTCDIAP